MNGNNDAPVNRTRDLPRDDWSRAPGRKVARPKEPARRNRRRNPHDKASVTLSISCTPEEKALAQRMAGRASVSSLFMYLLAVHAAERDVQEAAGASTGTALQIVARAMDGN